ncbi:MAG: DNA-3-methyladenine glycosylase I [Alphaproteobacteria bacterium]|nr:MAG: DNA-3-methyladenine glycosylase I [Alphaproteobacteria bacterium]
MVSFKEIRESAAKKTGGDAALMARMPDLKNEAELRKISASEYFSNMSFRIFSAGINQKMVRGKWPAFETAFHGFNPSRVAFMSEDEIEGLMQNTDIIRHLGKIRATHHNALAMVEIEKEHGAFGDYIANWPVAKITGLWDDLKARFKQLGGNSGPYFLRLMGKDGFILTNDVVEALNKLDVASGKLTSKKDRATVEAAFNAWHEETGLPHAHLSRILAIWN